MSSQIPVGTPEDSPVDLTSPSPDPQDPSADDGPRTMSRWLWIVYPLAMAAMSVVWGGVMQVLLGKQVAAIVPDSAGSAAALGVVTTVAAISSVISQPVVGRLSDRTRTRFLGRRNVWIFGGSIVGSLGLVLMSQVTSTAAVAIIWAILMWPLNAVQAGLAAVLPERVPVRLRGSISGIIGAAQMAGMYAGVAMAGLSTELFRGYLLVAAAFVIVACLFAVTTQDRPAPARETQAVKAGRPWQGLPGLREASDFWWAFAGRFLLVFGYFSVASFQLYILRDHIGLGDINEASQALVAISGLTTVLGLVASLGGGWVADKIGRLRIFVGLSTALFVPAGLIYWFVPTMTGAWVAAGTIGAAYGMYVAVDAALISRVLPRLDDAGRDLGIMNIANAGPQIIAPSIAGFAVAATGSYAVVFLMLIVCATLGALSVRFIKGVR